MVNCQSKPRFFTARLLLLLFICLNMNLRLLLPLRLLLITHVCLLLTILLLLEFILMIF